MEIIKLTQCGYCGRLNNNVTSIVSRNWNNKLVEVEAPWCLPCCRPLSPEERKNPIIKSWWAPLPLKERVLNKIDFGILPIIELCQASLIPTVFSCDGHGVSAPYVDFYDWEDLEKARLLLGEQGLFATIKKVKILVELYRLYIPKDRITPTKRNRHG